jgi:2-polyprenyl-6-methoxyphenol hydroxylase-like FAD-dependent oxidoreductase
MGGTNAAELVGREPAEFEEQIPPDDSPANICDRDPVRAWSKGAATLPGDAAHPMTLNLGRGTCQAIADAMQLACCLAHPTRPSVGLQDYERKRIKCTAKIVLASRRLGKVAQFDTPIC